MPAIGAEVVSMSARTLIGSAGLGCSRSACDQQGIIDHLVSIWDYKVIWVNYCAQGK